MSFQSAITARLGLDTSGVKQGMSEATREVEKGLQRQAAALNTHGGIILGSQGKIKKVMKSISEDILSGAGPMELLSGAMMKLSMAFKVGMGMMAGTTAIALIGKQCYDSAAEVHKLSKEISDLSTGSTMGVNFSSVESLKEKLVEAKKKLDEATEKSTSMPSGIKNGIYDTATLNTDKSSFIKDISKGGINLENIVVSVLKLAFKANADNMTNKEGDAAVEKASGINKKLSDDIATKYTGESDKRRKAITSKEAGFFQGDKAQEEIDVVRARVAKTLADNNEKRGALLDDNNLAPGAKGKIEKSINQDDDTAKRQGALEEAEINKKYRLEVEARARELADAKTMLGISDAKLKGQTSIAEQLAIELRYRDKITAATREGHTELAKTLQMQQQLDQLAQGLANYNKTPQQRQDGRAQERKTQRDRKNYDSEVADVKAALGRGTVITQGRRGEIAQRLRDNGEVPIPDGRGSFTLPGGLSDADHMPGAGERVSSFTLPGGLSNAEHMPNLSAITQGVIGGNHSSGKATDLKGIQSSLDAIKKNTAGMYNNR